MFWYTRKRRIAFTLIELLVVVAIIALLIAILLPSLAGARRAAKTTRCLTQLSEFGKGLYAYASDNRDALLPGRLPELDDRNWFAILYGRKKYRPTFLGMLSAGLSIPPFEDPQDTKNGVDRFGEAGSRQNYSSPFYVCPSVPAWTDERNGSYGYNYQFLGNSRLNNEKLFKNWPVLYTWVRRPGSTVAIADCMGTAASYPPGARGSYENNGRNSAAFGNEGFNLDPPRVDPANGEMAGLDEGIRTAVDPRHADRAAVLWMDGHAARHTPESLGYELDDKRVFTFEGENNKWSLQGKDIAWTDNYHTSDP
jgi:prepilin-type N-terminal cleavage/methylation domain-containing protein/prepilin-type processing-associated H-X9-DG protein